jgi:hypothetical protein
VGEFYEVFRATPGAEAGGHWDRWAYRMKSGWAYGSGYRTAEEAEQAAEARLREQEAKGKREAAE